MVILQLTMNLPQAKKKKNVCIKIWTDHHKSRSSDRRADIYTLEDALISADSS